MHFSWTTVALLSASNFVMLYAWYGHLRNMEDKPIWLVVLTSWAIALIEYCMVIPANRIGSRVMTLAQLKIVQEAVGLMVFVPFSLLVMKQSLSWNYAAAAVCILAAVYFIFRG